MYKIKIKNEILHKISSMNEAHIVRQAVALDGSEPDSGRFRRCDGGAQMPSFRNCARTVPWPVAEWHFYNEKILQSHQHSYRFVRNVLVNAFWHTGQIESIVPRQHSTASVDDRRNRRVVSDSNKKI